jgi:hypothetical protein
VRVRGAAVLLVVLALAAACSKKTPSGSPASPTTPPSGGTATSPPVTCEPASNEDVACRTAPAVALRLPDSSTVALASGVPLTAATQVLVSRGGQADLYLARQGACTLRQDDPAKTARLTVRFPAGALLSQQEGLSHCTIQGSVVTFCDTATIEATAALSQYSATCNPDPVTTIAVFSGTVHVTLQDGQPFDIGPGFELVVFPTPMEQGAMFTDDERSLFADQAKLVTPQAPSPTPTPSESPSESPTAPPID